MDNPYAWFVLLLPVSLICGFVADSARGSKDKGGFAWGFFLGPLGILVAAIIGVQDRLDKLPPAPPS
ncbi:MAG: hypothetical protein GX548_11685 [Lentisphaerae bacterium]|nr:hypothetical protein [Lentisphaerota bacterium]